MISRGYSYQDTPAHEHDCTKCEFMFSIHYHVNGDIPYKVDVYKQCPESRSLEGERYLLRWSSDGPDYHSGIDFKTLCAGWIESRHGWFNPGPATCAAS